MIAILKYNAGNVTSVENTIKRLGYDTVITDDENTLLNAKKVIFPGVGQASSAMQYLRERKLDLLLKSLTQPVLGICLGMQLLCNHSEEGDTEGLGIFDHYVRRFPQKDLVPHVGWNNFSQVQGTLFKNLDNLSDFYFVHSYFASLGQHTAAVTDYILPYSSALQKDNFYAVQFHPEKSAATGVQLLKNFLEL